MKKATGRKIGIACMSLSFLTTLIIFPHAILGLGLALLFVVGGYLLISNR